MNLTLRTKAVILTILFLILYVGLQVPQFMSIEILNPELVRAFLVSFFFFIVLWWVLGFRVKGVRFITILGYPSFIVFVQSLFLELIIFQNVERLTAKTASLIILLIFGGAIYLLILTVNILNISYLKRIPLAQAAKAANFLYALFTTYFAYLLILRAGVGEFLQIIMLSLTTFYIALNVFWFKKESRRQWLGETIAAVFTMAFLFVVFLLWPISAELASMIYIIVFYILLGLGLEERETTSTLMRLEYLGLLIVAIILMLHFAVWGINGAVL